MVAAGFSRVFLYRVFLCFRRANPVFFCNSLGLGEAGSGIVPKGKGVDAVGGARDGTGDVGNEDRRVGVQGRIGQPQRPVEVAEVDGREERRQCDQ